MKIMIEFVCANPNRPRGVSESRYEAANAREVFDRLVRLRKPAALARVEAKQKGRPIYALVALSRKRCGPVYEDFRDPVVSLDSLNLNDKDTLDELAGEIWEWAVTQLAKTAAIVG